MGLYKMQIYEFIKKWSDLLKLEMQIWYLDERKLIVLYNQLKWSKIEGIDVK
jgi:hypothetical protein